MLTGKVEVPRSPVEYREEILSIYLCTFGDAGNKGNSAAVYAVTQQSSGIIQGLVTSKSRLAKKSLTTPRLELVAGHTHGNQSCGQIEGSPERIPYRERLRLARQQCSPTLDQRGWKLQVVCEKSSSEDPGQELHRWDDGQPC